MNYAVYLIDTGRILKTVTTSEESINRELVNGADYVVIPDSGEVTNATHYVRNDGTIVEKEDQELDLSYSGLSVTITGIPSGSRVRLLSYSLIADDQPTEITFDSPGTYNIHIFAPPQYKDKSLEVVVG